MRIIFGINFSEECGSTVRMICAHVLTTDLLTSRLVKMKAGNVFYLVIAEMTRREEHTGMFGQYQAITPQSYQGI